MFSTNARDTTTHTYTVICAVCEQVSLDKTELEDARWCSLEDIQAALKVKKPLRDATGQTPGFWVPPGFAIANRLIREWVDRQRLQLE